VTRDKVVPKPFMHQTGEFGYWAGDGLKALELPYGAGDLAMVVLLPDEVEGLPDLEARLSADALEGWLADLEPRRVAVRFPRFRQSSRFALDEVLQSLGMTLAFDDRRADFTGISTEDRLSITAVLHEASVEVNEEGTEATAASGEVVGTRSAPRPPVEFRANHPFVFLIRDRRTGMILFLGRVVNPNG